MVTEAGRVQANRESSSSPGSRLHPGDTPHSRPPALEVRISDPTGCGDDYRAGLIFGGRTWADTSDEMLTADFEHFLLDDAGRSTQRQRALATADSDGAKRIVEEALKP